MCESSQYSRVALLARDKLKGEMRRCREECAEAEQRRDEALRTLRLLWAKSGPAGGTEATEGDEAVNPLLAEFKLYAAEVNTWLEQMRPLVESQRPQRAPRGATRGAQASTSAAPRRAPVDAQLLDFLHDAMDRIERMDTKVQELEDYQEGLRHDAQDAFDRVDTVAGPFPALPPLERFVPPEVLQRHEGNIATMRGELATIRTEVADQARRKGATRLDLQRLRTEQEQLKLKLFEVRQSGVILHLTAFAHSVLCSWKSQIPQCTAKWTKCPTSCQTPGRRWPGFKLSRMLLQHRYQRRPHLLLSLSSTRRRSSLPFCPTCVGLPAKTSTPVCDACATASKTQPHDKLTSCVIRSCNCSARCSPPSTSLRRTSDSQVYQGNLSHAHLCLSVR